MSDERRNRGAQLLSIGTAVPAGRISQAQAIELSAALAPEELDRSKIEALHRRSGVESRGAVIFNDQNQQSLYPTDAAALGPKLGSRLESFTTHATQLAVSATKQALADMQIDVPHITHLITVSCTGFESPGFDQQLMSALELRSTVRRTNIGFMGCHAAINGLAVAKAFVEAEPDALALVCCVELCSLHYHYGDRRDRLVANALFADGAATAIVGAGERVKGPRINDCESQIFPNSAQAMRWEIGDHGFAMTLAPEVPDLLRRYVPPWVGALLDTNHLKRAQIGGWAIHPGGPRIVRAVVESLELPADADAFSMDTLRRHGNMSSATILFIMREMWKRAVPRPWLGLAFGPGLAGEALLVR